MTKEAGSSAAAAPAPSDAAADAADVVDDSDADTPIAEANGPVENEREDTSLMPRSEESEEEEELEPSRASSLGLTLSDVDLSSASRRCWNLAVIAMSLCFLILAAQQLLLFVKGETVGFVPSSSSSASGGSSQSGSNPLDQAALRPSVHPQPPSGSSSSLTFPDRMIIVSGYSAGQSSDGGGAPDIAAAASNVDLSWLLYHFSDSHCLVVVDHVDRAGGGNGGGSMTTAADTPYSVPNTGREASAFLRFIIDHYDNLPSRMVFIHGNRFSWHNGDLVVILKHLNWSLPFANLNHVRENVGTNKELTTKYTIGPQSIPYRYQMIEKVWEKQFLPYFGRIPPYFDIHCCAQFLASRENIRAVPLAFWQNWLDYLLRPAQQGGVSADIPQRADVAILYEHLWTFLMTKGQWRIDIDDDATVELCKVLKRGSCQYVNDPATGNAVLQRPTISTPIPPTADEFNANGNGNGNGAIPSYPCRGFSSSSSHRSLLWSEAREVAPAPQLRGGRGNDDDETLTVAESAVLPGGRYQYSETLLN